MSNSWVDRDNNTPIFLRNIPPLNVPRKDDNLVPQSLNLSCKCPDARLTVGISNALIAEQEQSEEVRTMTPWHEQQNFFSWWGRLCGGRSGPYVEHNSTPFNSLQLRAAGEPDATSSLSLKVSSLTGALSLCDDACMDVP